LITISGTFWPEIVIAEGGHIMFKTTGRSILGDSSA